MKIAYLNKDYTEAGGTEKILCEKTNYLIEHGYEVSIITMFDTTIPTFFKYNPKIKIYSLKLNTEKETSQNIKLFLQRLNTILHQVKPDIAIAMDMRLGKYLYRATDGSKKIMESHSSRFKRKNKLSKLNTFWPGNIIANLYTRKQTQFIKKFDHFVVLTEEDRKQWSNLKDNISVIPNILEYQNPINIDYSNKRIIGVGRLSGAKAWEYLIKIWASIAHEYPQWKVDIFGDGHKEHFLRKLIKKYNIQDSFQIHQSTPHIKEEYAKSSIFVMTSRYEGLPMVLIEAMGLALPPVTFTFKCGPKDTIEHNKTGYLVKLFDTKGFAHTLKKLMDSEELRKQIGQAAQKEVREKYNKKTIMDKWIKLFKELKYRSE